METLCQGGPPFWGGGGKRSSPPKHQGPFPSTLHTTAPPNTQPDPPPHQPGRLQAQPELFLLPKTGAVLAGGHSSALPSQGPLRGLKWLPHPHLLHVPRVATRPPHRPLKLTPPPQISPFLLPLQAVKLVDGGEGNQTQPRHAPPPPRLSPGPLPEGKGATHSPWLPSPPLRGRTERWLQLPPPPPPVSAYLGQSLRAGRARSRLGARPQGEGCPPSVPPHPEPRLP